VSVPAQIAVLLALISGLFDGVPLDQMPLAERAVQEAAAGIPAVVCERFETAAKLADSDRETIIETARRALARFQSAAAPKPLAEPTPQPDPGPEAPTTLQTKAEVGSNAVSKAKT